MICMKPAKIKIEKIISVKENQYIFIINTLFIIGICNASIDEEEDFSFEFSYKGKINEDKEKLIDYLKYKAQSILIDKQMENNKNNTLENFIDRMRSKNI